MECNTIYIFTFSTSVMHFLEVFWNDIHDSFYKFYESMKKIWEIGGTILYVWVEVTFTTNRTNFGQIRLQTGQKLVHIISRISRNFSREMGHFFSRLARNTKREKCAALICFQQVLRCWVKILRFRIFSKIVRFEANE